MIKQIDFHYFNIGSLRDKTSIKLEDVIEWLPFTSEQETFETFALENRLND